ncbi:uncharacterized protein PF3D7_1120600-like isoform X2 [Argiope bruennichi]|uniref:uncharacterized protein PF3D7_1120600-like isoform X2 n=1 Tax=Argiope bruennichi TaxID=94029 RepID=UPI002493D209|nr:uncharacterized protein PF3D7_1120600-like isoform X2 [Argiope bruennichi]
MTHFAADKDDLYTTIFAELKHLGIKVPKVKKFKSNILKQEKIAQPSKSKIFGVSLADQEWIADCDYVLPKFIVSSITYLRQFSDKVGLFRKAGSNVRQRELRLKLEKGEDICGSEPNDVASLLKQWLRELPEPLIPQYMHDLFIRCQQLENEENRITANLLTCLLLPPNHLHTLKYLLCFLADFAAHSDENMMSAHNLALCMAPNIFVLNDSADKSSTNLVHIHVSIIQLLIENATKIGSIPELVTFQPTIQEGRSCSELDSSGDFLDTVSSKRKKQKNGHVQDLLSGIKKLVGQNSTTATNAKTPEKYWNSHTTAPRQPKLADQENILQNVTPKDKGIMSFGTVGRSGGHTRKKSFGLLRKKERKRQKSCHGNLLPVVTFNVIPPDNQTKETSNCNNLVKTTEENVLPTSDNKTCKLSKSESIKKSASESYLTPRYGRCHRLSLSSPKSSDAKLEIPSYFLQSRNTDKNMENSVQQLETIQSDVKKNDDDCNTVIPPKNLEIPSINIVTKPLCEEKESLGKISKDDEISKNLKPLIESETPLRPNIQELRNGGPCKRVSRKGSNVQRASSRGISTGLSTRASSSDLRSKYKNKSPQRKSKNSKTDLRSISDSQIRQGSRKSGRKSPNFDKSSHKGGLSRNEAFIVKPKSHRKNSLEHLENKHNEVARVSKKANAKQGKNNNNPLHKSQSLNSENGDKVKIGKNGTKRASRNGSLIRGRPNTVNTGLRCELRGNESIIATSESNEKRKSLKMNKKNEDIETNESNNSSDINKETNRGNELIIQASESHEKKKSIKINKNVVEANFDSVDMNKENKRGNEPALIISESREKRKSVRLSNKINESCIPEEIKDQNKPLDQKDTSLSTKFENFHLSSPINSSETLIDFINSMFSLEDKPATQEEFETQNLSLNLNRMSTRLSIDKHRRASLQLKCDRSSSGSGSKIPRLRSSLEAKRTSSLSEMTPEPKRKVSKSRGSDNGSISSSKIPTKKPDTSFDISSLQISLNDSCFKTPDNNFPASNSINWVSGSKYLGINSPQEDTTNRRESIALILKNNPGHVQAKVSMYDTRVRESVVCTRSVPSFSTPFEHFDNRKESRSAQKSHKKLHDSRSYDSAENFNRKKNKMRSPLPPPPKFSITDTSTPSASVPLPLHNEIANNCNESQNSLKEVSFKEDNCLLKKSPRKTRHSVKKSANSNLALNESENSFNLSIKDENNFSRRSLENVSHPLKEVTNISFEMKSPLIKDGYILPENVHSSGKRQNRLKRSSFNVKSPHKRFKRISRSESSPGRPRPYDKAHSRIKNSTSKSASNI